MTRLDLLHCVCRTLEGSIFFNHQPLPVLRSPVLGVLAGDLPVILIWCNEEDATQQTPTAFISDIRLHVDVRVTACPLEITPDEGWDEKAMRLADAVMIRLMGCGEFLRAFEARTLKYSRRTYANTEPSEAMICGESILFSGSLKPCSYGPESLPQLSSFGVDIDTAESGWDRVPEVRLNIQNKDKNNESTD